MLEVAQRAFDERRRTMQQNDVDTAPLQRRLQILQRPLHRLGRLEGVGAELTGDGHEHARPAHDRRIADRHGRPDRDVGDLADGDRHVVLHADERLRDGLRVGRRRRGVERDALRVRIDGAATAQGERGTPRLHHVVDAEAEAGEAVEVGLDLHLTDGAAVDGHARDARQCQQMRIDRPVGDVAQRVGIDRVRQQSELEDVHGARGERRELGLRHPHGQLAGERAEALGNALADGDRIDVAFERNDDDGQPIDGFGAQKFNTRGTVHRRLDGPGDDLLDLLGRKAGRLGLDRHLRGDELRENVERRTQCEENAGTEPNDR